jgi:cell division protease FtsH
MTRSSSVHGPDASSALCGGGVVVTVTVTGGRRCASSHALGELLVGVVERESAETADKLTIPLALAEWVDAYADVCEIGPGEWTNPPKWTQTEIGGKRYRHPLCLRVHFPAGTLLDDTGCVIHIEARETVMRSAEVSAYATPDNQAHARAVLDRLAERANELNPYRGRAVSAVVAR